MSGAKSCRHGSSWSCFWACVSHQELIIIFWMIRYISWFPASWTKEEGESGRSFPRIIFVISYKLMMTKFLQEAIAIEGFYLFLKKICWFLFEVGVPLSKSLQAPSLTWQKCWFSQMTTPFWLTWTGVCLKTWWTSVSFNHWLFVQINKVLGVVEWTPNLSQIYNVQWFSCSCFIVSLEFYGECKM